MKRLILFLMGCGLFALLSAQDTVFSGIVTDKEKNEPLNEVFESMKQLENGAKASVSTKDSEKTLREYLGKVLPNFDRDRVYTADIKKLISWYNLLIENGYDNFEDQDTIEAEAEENAANDKAE